MRPDFSPKAPLDLLESKSWRIEEIDLNEFAESESHLWAVSYADFLMVLLSFFVIFFSYDQKQQEKIKEDISEITKSHKTLMKVEKDLQRDLTAVSQNQSTMDQPNPSLAEVSSSMKSLKETIVTKQLDKNTIVIYLPESIYGLNEIFMSEKGTQSFKKIIQTLQPYRDQIELTIVGHSDNSILKPQQQQLISSNFALSSLRAAEALKLAIVLGFPSETLSVKGEGSVKRNTRSLSIIINAKENLVE